jgi:hypothetical protein
VAMFIDRERQSSSRYVLKQPDNAVAMFEFSRLLLDTFHQIAATHQKLVTPCDMRSHCTAKDILRSFNSGHKPLGLYNND